MKKVILTILGILMACVLIAGLFSGGVLVGKFLLPDTSENTPALADLPVIAEPAQPDAATPTDIPAVETAPTTQENDEPAREMGNVPEIPPPPVGLEALFVPFWEARDLIHQYYVEQPVDDEILMQGAINGMIEAMAVVSDTQGLEIPEAENYAIQGGTPAELVETFTPFWQTWALTHAVDNELLVQGAISGMLDSLGDPHTSYMNPQDYHESTSALEGTDEYEGIGAWVDITNDYLTIISPFPGSPAEKAGLKPGDKVLAIDGEDMAGMDGELVRQRILGPAGTTIVMTISRAGMEPFDVDVTRASVTVPSVESYMREDNIGYVRLFLFGDKSPDEVREALERLMAEDPIGIIFDLRYNGGGAVDSAVKIASEFIDDGVIFYEIFGDGSEKIYDAKGRGIATDIPLVVLVNEGSASASEIVAGAIQDYGRAPLVGTQTFGKGSVQYWLPLSNEQGAVRVTIASWWTPDRRHIHEIGLEPDVPIVGVSQAAIDEGFDITSLEMEPDQIVILSEEDINNGVDPQVDKAVEILLEQHQQNLQSLGQ